MSKFKPDIRIHPSEVLQETLLDMQLSEGEFSPVIHERSPITEAVAARIEFITGVSASYWLELQHKYDHLPGVPFKKGKE